MSTIANINGSDVRRLNVIQLGSSIASTVLQTSLLDESQTQNYTVGVERFTLHTDIPILPKDTELWTLYKIGDHVTSPLIEDNEEVKRTCVVGPVYNFADLLEQIAQWCKTVSTVLDNLARIEVDGIEASRKNIGLRGNYPLWSNYMLIATPTFEKLFKVKYPHGQIFLNHPTYTGAEGLVDENWDNLVDPAIRSYKGRDALQWALFNSGSATIVLNERTSNFENRLQIRIDSVLPVPFETLVISTKHDQRSKSQKRYNFLSIDWPKEHFQHTMINTDILSDEIRLTEPIYTGRMTPIVKNLNSFGQNLMVGSTQDHRYELFLIRKVINDDYTVKQQEERIEFKPGDYFELSLVFTKQV